MKAEDRLLLICCKKDISAEDLAVLSDIDINNTVSWEIFLGKVFFNKLAGLVYCYRKDDSILPQYILSLLEATYVYQKERNEFLLKEMKTISDEMSEKVDDYAFIKGSFLNNIIFDPGTRTSDDIDILISVKDIKSITELLTHQGFVQGQIKSANHIIKAKEAEKVASRMFGHELIDFIKINDNNKFLRNTSIDVNFKLDDLIEDKFTINLLKYIKYYEVEGYKFKSLQEEAMIVYLACHIFREATSFVKIKQGNDLRLYKFIDLVEIVQKVNIDWELVLKIADQTSQKNALFYSVYIVNILYPELEMKKVLDQMNIADLNFLNLYMGNRREGDSFYWDNNIEERIFDMYRKKTVSPSVNREFNKLIQRKNDDEK
ncbi:TPA: nucleotidyltransferase family protein [Streptococcus pneumoniae]